MKNKGTIVYWVLLIPFCGMMLFSGIANLLHVPEALEVMQHLGYPQYMLTLLGIAKLLGVLALLAPRFPILKEWAYAGFTFDLTGAAFSHLAVNDPVSSAVGPLIFLVVLGITYQLRPPSRRPVSVARV